jgi:hypothetical protein
VSIWSHSLRGPANFSKNSGTVELLPDDTYLSTKVLNDEILFNLFR